MNTDSSVSMTIALIGLAIVIVLIDVSNHLERIAEVLAK